ncbi:MAG: PA4642 family protein [Alcanivoracaceae bacterium]
MARKDKKQVIGEPMTDEQVQAFLHSQPESGLHPDHHALLRAYQSLRCHDFERFLALFIADGRDLNARAPDGRTVLSVIASHQQGEDYAEVMRSAGAA